MTDNKNVTSQKPVSDEATQTRVDAMYALVHEETELQRQRSVRQVIEKLPKNDQSRLSHSHLQSSQI